MFNYIIREEYEEVDMEEKEMPDKEILIQINISGFETGCSFKILGVVEPAFYELELEKQNLDLELENFKTKKGGEK